MTSKLFLGGVPTGPDVSLLMEQVPAQPGQTIAYAQLETLLGIQAGTHRFQTVVTSWRKRLFRERNVQTKAEGGAIVFLTPDRAQDEGMGRVGRIARAAIRNYQRVGSIPVDTLTTGERQAKQRLLVRESGAIAEASRASSRALAVPGAKGSSIVRLAGKS